jgi:DtxR family transcriptional regulator, Mn-dependent transcriptional regulator
MPRSGLRRDHAAGNSEAVEDYAKAIYALAARTGEPVTTTALADRLEISPGSVTAMLKRMGEMKLVRHEPYHGVSLTTDGERVALEVMRHHRLIESYLEEALGMPWDRVHDEAEVLEYYISEELERRMSEALGDPSRDPHGDPIPSAELDLADDETLSLADLGPGRGATFTRVSDSDPAMLRYLAEQGIRPGARLRVTGEQPFGGPLLVEVDGREHALGGGLADKMRVELKAGK